MSLPGNEQELMALFQKGKRHPAMKMASLAFKNKRSPKQAFMLLVGISGAGKSSTVNYLFDTEIAPTSESESQSRTTVEYVVQMTSTEWRIPDLAISIIDTPGFDDTDGLKQDAGNILSIKNFLKEHPFIECKKRQIFPNIVLIVQNIQDNRYKGTHSQFAKMLKGLSQINVVDHSNPNVVVVLTHAASTPPKGWKETVERKKEEVKAITHVELGVLPEVVVQENLPDEYFYEKENDYHILPNGEKQPKTLFQACKRIFKSADDKLGYEALAVCFRPGEIKNVTRCHVTPSPGIDTEAVQTMYLNLIQSVAMVSDSEVGKMLEDYKGTLSNPVIQNDILLLQVKLRDLNMKNAKDLQTQTMDQLVSRMYPVRINVQMEKILEVLFGIKYEQITGIDVYIGSGYNIFTDARSVMRPLVLSGSKGKYGLSSDVLLKPCSSHVVRCKSVSSTQEYITDRLQSLNVNISGGAQFHLFNMKMQAGYNSNKSHSTSNYSTDTRASFAIEQTIYKAEMEQPYKMSPELKRDITILPEFYDLKDEFNVNEWKRFFDKWGYYVIIGTDIGGSISGEVSSSGHTTRTREEAINNAELALSAKLTFLQASGELDVDKTSFDQELNLNSAQMHSTKMQWNGGDKELYKNTMENLTMDDWKRWTESLVYKPAALWTSLDIYPLYHLVAEVDQNKCNMMQKIFNLVLTGKFKYEPPGPDCKDKDATSEASVGCFHAESMLLLDNGQRKLMKDVLVGDTILTMNADGKVQSDVIIAWIHKVIGSHHRFLKICHENGCIRVTPNHIVFVGNEKSAKHACSICPGDKLHFLNYTNQETSSSLVTVCSGDWPTPVRKMDG